MVDLQLDSNEEILLQAKRVWRYEEDENQYLKNLYLSNKNLICVYEETKGFFSKAETIVDKISLRDIRVVDGIVQVEKVDDDDYEETLQILYRNGKRELYGLDEDDDEDIDKEYRRWESAISKAVIKYLENCESMTPISDKPANTNGLADTQTLKPEKQPTPNVKVEEQNIVYCSNCGAKNSVGAKYCQNCGVLMGTVLQHVNRLEMNAKVQMENEKCNAKTDNKQHISSTYSERKQEFVGKIYKCPNCGEVLKAFETNCPACGLELRGIKATSAVREFSLKLEAIEANREYEKQGGLFAKADAKQRISKTDEQKVNLIKNFPIPNSKEDILEFMILATSNVNMRLYDSTNTNISKGELAINDAWISKIRQTYEKARKVYGNEESFEQIQDIYDRYRLDIKKTKKQGIKKWIMWIGWMPLIVIIDILLLNFRAPGAEKEEIERLETIESEIQIAMKNGEYKKALLDAERLVYSPSVRRTGKRTEHLEQQWNIKREILIDEIIETAQENGVYLERPSSINIETEDDEGHSGFIEGFKEGMQPGLDAAKEAVEVYNRTMREVEDTFTNNTGEILEGE